eukprot:TRINITY_DN4196_c0_g2_i3.p1 TRINITY_DN4196_c0_g2~~TRINITY_DN4196_c0_g2_i3.p1  ORF type:complete len:517 (-),score=158.85 TRINITY_DN4196_c0_g2_i3:161-1711(-)
MIRRPPRSTQGVSSAASDVYKRQVSTQSTWEFEMERKNKRKGNKKRGAQKEASHKEETSPVESPTHTVEEETKSIENQETEEKEPIQDTATTVSTEKDRSEKGEKTDSVEEKKDIVAEPEGKEVAPEVVEDAPTEEGKKEAPSEEKVEEAKTEPPVGQEKAEPLAEEVKTEPPVEQAKAEEVQPEVPVEEERMGAPSEKKESDVLPEEAPLGEKVEKKAPSEEERKEIPAEISKKAPAENKISEPSKVSDDHSTKEKKIIPKEEVGKFSAPKEEQKGVHEEKASPAIKRRDSKFELQKGDVMLRPEFIYETKETDKDVIMWELMQSYLGNDIKTIQRQIVNHVEYTLARTRFNFDKNGCYYATAYSVRDRLIESWNDTNQHMDEKDPKRIYYMSLEFLMGRMLQNALVNLGLEEKYSESLMDLGYKLEELYDEEHDAGLGNGGLGRLAACFLDSMTTLDYPAWGYGIRYNYGIFKQEIRNGYQMELPDFWLAKGNPWEVERLDVNYTVHFLSLIHI